MAKKEKIIIGADHAGFKLKEEIKKFLSELNYVAVDLGVHSDENSSDYPKTALKVAQEVAGEKARGILICGTGIGEAIVANKVMGVRAANCFNEYTAKMSREHNDSNILCIGARILDTGQAKNITKIWLESKFDSQSRHGRRVKQIKDIEKNMCR